MDEEKVYYKIVTEIWKAFRTHLATVADITDPADLEKCSIETCRTVIVSPTDDVRTVKALLAVSVLAEQKACPVRINAIISKREYRLPPTLAEKHGKECFVSLEQRMACGVGACLGCACRTKRNDEEYFAHVCKDGPVFRAEEVIW